VPGRGGRCGPAGEPPRRLSARRRSSAAQLGGAGPVPCPRGLAAPVPCARLAGMTVFNRAYEATPSWAIGRPQPVVIRLADAGLAEGDLLDVGCGTGENALELARRGLSVTGIDVAALAVRRAREQAAQQRLVAEFVVMDALRLADLDRTFDTILDVGLYHVLQPAERTAYAASLRGAARPGVAAARVLERPQPVRIGPARVSRGEIHSRSPGWRVESIEPETLDYATRDGHRRAWLARIRACDGRRRQRSGRRRRARHGPGPPGAAPRLPAAALLRLDRAPRPVAHPIHQGDLRPDRCGIGIVHLAGHRLRRGVVAATPHRAPRPAHRAGRRRAAQALGSAAWDSPRPGRFVAARWWRRRGRLPRGRLQRPRSRRSTARAAGAP